MEVDNETIKQEREGPEFRAMLSSVAVLESGLRGLSSGKRDQHTICEVEEAGIKFTTTDPSKSSQGCVSIGCKIFQEWELKRRIVFRINLAILLDCVNCVGPSNLANTVIRLAFFAEEECFFLSLMEGEVITECKIRTMCDEDGNIEKDGSTLAPIDFAGAFKAVPGEINKAILPSEHLRDALSELAELSGATTVRMLLSPFAPFFRLSTHGQSGSCEIEFPQGEESFTQFICPNTFEFEYRLSLLRQAGKALVNAEKTFLRMNAEGMLSVQHMILHEGGNKLYVDFFVLADATGSVDEAEDVDFVETRGNDDEED